MNTKHITSCLFLILCLAIYLVGMRLVKTHKNEFLFILWMNEPFNKKRAIFKENVI